MSEARSGTGTPGDGAGYEQVPWWEAVGRDSPASNLTSPRITHVGWDDGDRWPWVGGNGWRHHLTDSGGLVSVVKRAAAGERRADTIDIPDSIRTSPEHSLYVALVRGGWDEGEDGAADVVHAVKIGNLLRRGLDEEVAVLVAGGCEHSDRPTRGPLFVGSNAERQSVGHPGHCDRCSEVGHVKAHPDLGCSDVGCYSHHDEPVPAPESPEAPEGQRL